MQDAIDEQIIKITPVEYHSATNWSACAELPSSNVGCYDSASTTVTTQLTAAAVITTMPVP